jgi:hypothetical protein
MSIKIFVLSLWMSILGLSLVGCGAQSPGPQVWIDKPVDGSQLPLEPIIIQVHAFDENGIASVAYYIDGQQMNQASMNSGGLGELMFEWNPSSTGNHQIEVRAIDQAGNEGLPAFSLVTIGSEINPSVPEAIPSPTGSTMPTNTTSPVAATPTLTLVPPSPTPENTLPAPPPPPPDTHPPDITIYAVSPTTILTQGGGCSDDPRTATVTVIATDSGGIASATVFWNVSGDTGDAPLAFIGSDSYQGQVGPVNKTGTMSLFVTVTDQSGNSALTDVMNVEVQNCIQ